MENITSPSATIIPTVDLSPFLKDGDEISRKKVKNTIYEAITNLGVFEVQNHGVALNQCEKLLELTKKFFSYSDEVKMASTQEDMEKSGAGYMKQDEKLLEYLYMYSPDIKYNGIPNIPEDYRETIEEVFRYYVKISQIMEGIINDCLGLPPNFLKTYNDDRCSDFMFPMHYTLHDVPVVREESIMFAIILQDETSNLEFFIDGVWIPIIPKKGNLIVIMCDLLKVLSNKKIRNVTHRDIKNAENKRLAVDFAYNLGPNKWVEPLIEHSKKLGVKPMYRGFVHKEYTDMLTSELAENPLPNPEDFIDIVYYEI